MSAVWGHISRGKGRSSVDTMASEYKRKCKLDGITETLFKNALIGFGQQIINEEDRHEAMPYIADGGDTIIVADAIIDNKDELIAELIPVRERPADASEIPSGKLITLAYEKWHYDLARHLKGLFSVAVYNTREGKLFLCVDQCACRCLYYHADDEGCTFSTLISPIKEAVAGLRENAQYITDFLCLPGLLPNVSATETPVKDVLLVEAGCSVTIDVANRGEAPVISRYYTPRKIKVSRNIKKAQKQFLDTYSRAVKDAVRTNGNVAMALSGGFDSSSVAVLAARELSRDGKTLDSYTYVPFYKKEVQEGKPSYNVTDETDDVKAIAAMYPNIRTHFEDDGGEACTVSLDELVDVMEGPYKAFVNLHTLLNIYKKAGASGSKVFLNGQCGNSSVSFGNIDTAAMYLYRKGRMLTLRKYFYSFCKLIEVDGKESYSSFLQYIKHEAEDLEEEGDYSDLVSPFVRRDLAKAYDIDGRAGESARLLKGGPATPAEDFDISLYNPASYAYIGAMETKLGLYTGMVFRDATRDITILDYCHSLPYEYFSYNGVPRYLIRGFMKDLIPNRILYPLKKTGVQSADWLIRLDAARESVLSMTEKSLVAAFDDPASGLSEYLDKDKISEYLKGPVDFTEEKETEVTNLLVALVFAKFEEYAKK